MKLGYCCINVTLRESKTSVYTNRTLIRRNYTKEKAGDLALQNVKDLYKILQWNEKNNIRVFRITSNLFPRCTDGELSDRKSVV